MTEPTTKRSKTVNLAVDLRIVVISLLIIMLGMLMSWRPWSAVNGTDRSITVTGNATLKSAPDEYVFYPTYEFKNADKDAALAQLTQQSDTVVAKLKALGVTDNNIKTNSSGYDKPLYYTEPSTEDVTYSLQLIITVSDKDLAQKVQDYLVTTTPTGSVSPQSTFSEAKRQELNNQARDEATKDARAKAEQSAKNLGFKLGKVKSITDGTGFDQIMPMDAVMSTGGAEAAVSRLTVQPGESELNYSVTVIYYIR